MPDLTSFLADLGAYVEAEGGGTLGSSLTLGQFAKNLSIGSVASSLTETQGQPSNDPAGIDFPRIQCMTKSTDYAAGRARAFFIHSILHNPNAPIIVGGYACNVRALQVPFKIGMSESQEHMFSCNYQFDVM